MDEIPAAHLRFGEYRRSIVRSFLQSDKMKQEGDVQTVKCSYCGEDMECPKNMLRVDKHVCSFCGEVMEDGMSEEEIKSASKRERMLSRYQNDVDEMADTIFTFAYPENAIPKEFLKKMSKRELEENSFHCGVILTLNFILHAAGPETLMSIKNSQGFRSHHVTDEDFEETIKNFKREGIDVDLERLETFEGELKTAEGIAKMFNWVIFKGDWKKQLEWEEKHGQDVELIKKIMSETEER